MSKYTAVPQYIKSTGAWDTRLVSSVQGSVAVDRRTARRVDHYQYKTCCAVYDSVFYTI